MIAAIESSVAKAPPAERVHMRRVYYVSGFDPRGAGYYHRLYREEAVKQSVLHEAHIKIGPRERRSAGVHAWKVEADWQGERVSTDYQFLRWDDIVREHWEPKLHRLLGMAVRAYTKYAQCGAFARLRKHFRGPFFTAIYPFVCLLLVALLTMGIAGLMFASVKSLVGSIAWSIVGSFAAAIGVLWASVRLVDRLAVFWLLRINVFLGGWSEYKQAQLDRRAEELAHHILQEQESAPCDEVLLIGHSVGSVMAVAIGARLAQVPIERRHNISILTIGQCIPLLGMLPDATVFRGNLQALAEQKDLPWLDMNARADPLCFSQANPLDICGVVGAAIGRPIIQVVRPFRMFHPHTYARLRRDKMRLHFQYMMASELPSEYDYFRMTAGPSRLRPY